MPDIQRKYNHFLIILQAQATRTKTHLPSNQRLKLRAARREHAVLLTRDKSRNYSVHSLESPADLEHEVRRGLGVDAGFGVVIVFLLEVGAIDPAVGVVHVVEHVVYME